MSDLWKLKTLRIFLPILLLFVSFETYSQNSIEQGLLNTSASFNKARFNGVVITELAVSTAAMVGLNYLWYKKFPHSHFHLFNDNKEWLNMDKVGHATTVYNIAAAQYNVMRWCGVKNDASIAIGGFTGLAYLTMVEIFDGFSSEWGFSKGDMAANMFGSAFFMSQQFGWGEQRIQMRFSYHHSIFAKYNPNELGANLPQRMLKDYNGQSYWLSFNISSFLRSDNFPRWFNADIGYGAEGMTGAITNPTVVHGKPIPEFVRQRKLFFGLDAAWARSDNIPFPSWANIFRIPTPVLEYKLKSKQLKPHLLYY